MASIRPAASVLLASLSPTPISQAIRQNYKLLMVKRSSKNRFMPNTHVFPGGVVESSDGDQKWAQMCGWQGDAKELAFRIAAIREVFEEVNVLISSSKVHISAQEMAEWRTKVQKDASQFYNMCSHFNLSPAPNLLRPHSHWITPEVEKYRYDTKFFVATMPSTVHKEAIDAAEVTDLSWFSPDEAIDAHKKGKINLPPPTWITLEVLTLTPRLEDLLAAGDSRFFFSPSSPTTTPETILPFLPHAIPASEGLTMALPGDEEYPQEVLKGKKGEKHRMTIKGATDYAYENSKLKKNLSSKL